MSRSIKSLTVLATSALLAGLAPVQSQASLVIELQSGVTTVTVSDNGVGDIDPTLGSVSFTGAVGAFDVNVSTGVSKPLIGSATEPRLNLTSVNLSSAATGSISVRVTSTDFTGPVGAAVPTLLDFGGTTNGLVSIAAYLDNANAPFGISTVAGALGPYGPGAFDDSDASLVSLSAPYSATLEALIVHDNPGDFSSFSGEFRVVPEPGSLALIAIGAGMLGYRRRRHA